MTSISWKLNRLRAMSVPEVGHRGVRALLQRLEQVAILVGWRPCPRQPVSHRTSLFQSIDTWRASWDAHFDLDHDKLTDLTTGTFDIFSYVGLSVGRPVDWHKDPLTGQTSPLAFGKTLDYRDSDIVGDVKVLWELGRHQHLIPLAVGYVCSGNESYRDAVVEQIDGWLDANPYGLGVHWSSSLECGLRLISWAVVHSLFVLHGHGQGLFSASRDPTRLGHAIYQHAWFIRHHLSRFSSANNHLIGELSGLWIASRVFDLGRTGDSWARFARNELEEQARLQVHGDGVSKEQAIYYHLWVLEYFLLVWLVGERNDEPFSESFRDRILSMSDFLEDVSIDDGAPPQIGDADDGFVTRFEPCWSGDAYYEVRSSIDTVLRNRRTDSGRKLPQKSFWYALIAGTLPGDAGDPAPPIERDYPVVYDEGGYAILGDETLRILFDAGPLGYPSIAAHGHADALSICLGLEDQWWLIDPGTYSYHRDGEWRDYFRGTSAHNTVEINGLNQSQIGGPFLWLERARAKFREWGRKSNERQFVSAEHDGYRSLGVTHYRGIEYNPAGRTIEITDTIKRDASESSLQVTLYFHFSQEIGLEIWNSVCRATRPESENSLRFDLDESYTWKIVQGQDNPIQGWYSPSLGMKVPAPVLVGTRTCPPLAPVTSKIEIFVERQ